MNDDNNKWETEAGAGFLKKIGVKQGDNILDFGAGKGSYSVPAAFVSGETGVVYAVEMEEEAAKELINKAKAAAGNIKIIKGGGGIKTGLKGNSVDFAMAYDVLHYMGEGKRAELYGEIRRVLKSGGIFSVYPKHISGDNPQGTLADKEAGDIIKEAEKAGFDLSKRHCGKVRHDDCINYGCVFNFIKTNGR